MEATGSRHTVTDLAIGLSAFVVFTLVALYAFLLTRPTGWNLAEWSMFLLCIAGTTQLALAALKRRRARR